MKVRLRVFTDDITGTKGFGLVGARHDSLFASEDGQGIAHDILEHQNGPARIGEVVDEMEALGGMWWVRGRMGQISERSTVWSPEQLVAGDLERMYEESRDELDYDSMSILAPRTMPCEDDIAFEEIIQHSKGALRLAATARHFHDEAERAEWFERLDDYHRIAFARMRIGWRKARRRFPNSYEAFNLFWSIQQAVKRAAPQIEMEGQEFMLTTTRDAGCHVHEVYR